MTLELRADFLGLGSIVRLDGESGSGLFVVLARGAYRPDTDQNAIVPRYLVGPHPHGQAPDHETFPILAGEIDEVVFQGYTDEADADFLADLLDQIENGRRPTEPARQFTEALTAIPEARSDQADDAAATQAHPDPFSALRRLAEQEDRRNGR